MERAKTYSYEIAGPTINLFHESKAFVRGIMGPFGSGKSTACAMEILKKSYEQEPSPDGIRRTRWAVIRNSYPELKSTTIKTWCELVPQTFGKMTFDSPITHSIKTPGLEIEVYFMALDKPDDQRKLLSLELTGAWINECREIPKTILDALTGRVGRYPSKANGGCTWSGIIMDTNPPDTESWYYKLAEQETPRDWDFFKQPAGDSLEAENIKNLPENYYERIKSGKDEDWVKVYVKGEYGFVTEGKPVYPMYRDSVYVSNGLLPIGDTALLIGADFGLTPSAVIGQKLVDGRWLILDEFTTENCGVERFAKLLTEFVSDKYPDFDVTGGWGDPAGNQRAFSDERTAFEILKVHTPWRWRPAPSNDFTMRREVVISALNRMVDGQPGIVISPKCAMLRKGFAGGYHFKILRSGDGTQTMETPNKNKWSHTHDALQYLLLGGGESNVILNRKKRKEKRGETIANDLDYNVFG